MATRSCIAMKNDNGTYTGIYCHWGGMPDERLPLLTEYYNEKDKVKELMSLGSLSSLGEELHPSGNPFKRRFDNKVYSKHTFDAPEPGVTVAHYRDRILTGQCPNVESDPDYWKPITAKALMTVYNQMDCAYVYWFTDGKWNYKGV